ncbi:hypothetical protein N9N03_02185, partial [Chlamydiia bacterium]|nr:hypothetical protein [Chlamydiia bacterium]
MKMYQIASLLLITGCFTYEDTATSLVTNDGHLSNDSLPSILPYFDERFLINAPNMSKTAEEGLYGVLEPYFEKDSFSQQDTNDMLRSIEALDTFIDVTVSVYGNNEIFVSCIPNPKIVDVEIINSDPKFNDKIKKMYKREKRLTLSRIEEIYEEVSKIYKDAGLFDASVLVNYKKHEDGYILVITVNEGDVTPLKDVVFSGFSDELMAQLQGRLILKKGSIMDLFSKKYVSQKAIESDTMTILNILSLNGYNSPIITSNTSKNDEKGGNVLTWILSAGEKSLIEKITITGNSSLSDSEILSGIGVKNVISDSIIDQYKRRLSTLYKTKGYVNANIRISRRPVMTIDKESEDRFDINIEIKENSVYRINGLSYEGNDVTRPRVFENELTFNIGEKYNHTKVTQSINKLYALDIFESVDIVTDIDENDELTLKIVVQEKDKLKKFSAGYNYDWTNKKHTGQLSIATTNFDISGITRIGKDGLSALSGNGQTFSGEFQVTDKSYVYGFSFYEPHILDTNFGLRVGLNHDQVSYTRDFTANDVTLPLYFDSNKTRGSIGLTAHVGDFSRVSLGLSGYKNGGNEDAEDYTYTSYNASFSTRFINMKTSNLSLSLSTSKSKGLVYDRGTTQDGPNDDNTHFKGWTPEGYDVTDIRGSLNLAYYIPSGLKLKLNASTTQTFTPD